MVLLLASSTPSKEWGGTLLGRVCTVYAVQCEGGRFVYAWGGCAAGICYLGEKRGINHTVQIFLTWPSV
jgi:hypothetical protein